MHVFQQLYKPSVISRLYGLWSLEQRKPKPANEHNPEPVPSTVLLTSLSSSRPCFLTKILYVFLVSLVMVEGTVPDAGGYAMPLYPRRRGCMPNCNIYVFPTSRSFQVLKKYQTLVTTSSLVPCSDLDSIKQNVFPQNRLLNLSPNS